MSDIITCPKCGYRFSRSYARITACKGCPESILSCPSIKCPKCGHEFRW